MAYDLIIEREAELDLEQAVTPYDEQGLGLGQEFIGRVDEVFDRIREMPEIHPVAYKTARLALVRRFPYVISCVFDGNMVYVMAVFHGHREPNVWQDRLP